MKKMLRERFGSCGSLLATLIGVSMIKELIICRSASAQQTGCSSAVCSVRVAACSSVYDYSPCFDSCYYMFRPEVLIGYDVSLGAASDDGAHFFVPNSRAEFDHVIMRDDIAQYKHTDTFWLGIQDFARNGAGKLQTTDNQADPDGVWQWHDGSNPAINSSQLGNSSSGFFVHPSFDWLQWASIPASGDTVAYLKFNNETNSWLVHPSSDRAIFRTSIFEVSQVCQTCSKGQRKFLDKCYQIAQNPTDHTTASSNCNQQNSTLWSPRTDATLLFASSVATSNSSSFWLGLSRENATFRWAVDDAEVVAKDALDIATNEPSSEGRFFRVTTDQEWVADASESGLYRGVCQKPAEPNYKSQVYKCQTTNCSASRCPQGYTYNSCYDSCFKVVKKATAYHKAQQDCLSQGAHLFAPNSQEEFNYVTSLMSSLYLYEGYWIGLQDYVRRGAGNLLSNYQKDPDGIWQWVDGSAGSVESSKLAPVPEGFADPARPWQVWQSLPLKTANHQVAYVQMSYVNPLGVGWLFYPSSDMNSERGYVCEYSNACASCPRGWSHWMDKCFQFNSSSVAYQAAWNWCRNQNASLLAPRTESTLILARLLTVNISSSTMAPWVGLDRTRDGRWRWASDLWELSNQDSLDIMGTNPSSGEDAFRFSSNDAETGWIPTTPSSLRPFYCMIDPNVGPITTTTISKKTSGSTNGTTTVQAGVVKAVRNSAVCSTKFISLASGLTVLLTSFFLL